MTGKRYRLLFLLLILILLPGCHMPHNRPPTFIPPPAYATPTSGPGPTPRPTDPPPASATSSPAPTNTAAPTLTGTPPPTETPPATATVPPTSPPPPTATPQPTQSVNEDPILYRAQAGDTLSVVATHFGVKKSDIESEEPLPQESFINPGQLLIIPRVLFNTTSAEHLLPDSEFVFSPAIVQSADFPDDVETYVNQAGGYLSRYRDYLTTTEISGGEIVARIAQDNSINPYLLLALLEYQSGWVFGQPNNLRQMKYPMGHVNYKEDGLVNQLRWAVNQLSIGYYGWREGRLTEVHLVGPDKPHQDITARINPQLNAGTAALQYYFSQVYESDEWIQALDPNNGFPATYQDMFGDPTIRAERFEPLFPHDLTQPELALPFRVGSTWTYTGGPHGAWEREGSMSAIDFAPTGFDGGCSKSYSYVTASMPGRVLRAEDGVVIIDGNDDGFEQTGWVLLYLHIAEAGRVEAGTYVQTGDKLGHPSCEGGTATGTHVHMARKFNGEWMTANGPIPFTLSGWTVHSGEKPYKGKLTKGNQTVVASPYSAPGSEITHR